MLPLLLISAAMAAQDVRLQSPDGVRIHATAERVSGATSGTVLVHMEGRSAADWSYLAQRLSRSGLSSIAPDLRGHGSSPSPHDPLTEDDYKAMQGDVQAAVDWLHAQGVSQVSCTGAALGANLCLRVAASDPSIVNVVMLSPGMNIKGVTTGDVVATYGDRPLLLVASTEDTYSARTGQVLADRAKGQAHFEQLEGAGHGTKMLNRDPALEGIVQSWLLGTFELASGDVVHPRPGLQVDPGSVDTTGEKLDSHK